MANPSGGWDVVPVYGKWNKDTISDGGIPGSVEFTFEVRVTSSDGVIYPKGFKKVVNLDNTGSLSTSLPAVDDPNIVEKEWSIKVTEKFLGGEEYYIKPRMAHLDLTPPGLNLNTVLIDTPETPNAALLRGVAGGVAALDADGDVIDAEGNKITGGGGGASPTFAIVLTPSNDATGVQDRTAINSATNSARLLGTGCNIILKPGEWYVDDAMIVYSRQKISAHQCNISRVGTAGNIIRNAAALPTRTVNDATATLDSFVVTSATANFTSADVGARIGIVGGGMGGSTWYGTIVSVGTSGGSTTATLTTSCDVAVTNAKADIFSSFDDDITIEGGHWKLTVAPLDGHQPTATYLNSFASAFRRINRLKLFQTTWSSAGPAGQGGKFTISIGDCTNVSVLETWFAGTSGDGVHLSGPINGARVVGVYGTTGDDMVVAGVQDNNTPYITDTQGPIKDWITDGVISNNSWCSWKLYDLGKVRKHQCSNIVVRNISGWTQVQMLSILNATAESVFIENVRGIPGSTFPMVHCDSQNMSVLEISKLCWTSTNAASKGIVRLMQPRNLVRIQDLSFSRAPSGTNHFVQVEGNLNGSTWGLERLTVSGLGTSKQWSGSAQTFATLNGVYLDSTVTGGNDSEIVISDVNCPRINTGILYNKAAAAGVNNVTIRNATWSGTSIASLPASDTTGTRLSLTGVKHTGTNIATTSSALTVVINNVHAICTAPAFNVLAGGSLRVENNGSWRSTGTNTTTINRAGTETLSVNGAGFPVTLSTLTPQVGDIATTVANANTLLAGVSAQYDGTLWRGPGTTTS